MIMFDVVSSTPEECGKTKKTRSCDGLAGTKITTMLLCMPQYADHAGSLSNNTETKPNRLIRGFTRNAPEGCAVCGQWRSSNPVTES